MRAAAEFLDPVIERVAVPRRIADGVRRIVGMLPRLSAGKAGRFGRTDLMAPALDVIEAERIAAGGAVTPAKKPSASPKATTGRPPARANGGA